jgi:hypothetical protein
MDAVPMRLGTLGEVGAADAGSAEVWLFDLDGCLVDSFGATDLRPLAHEALGAVRSAGAHLVLWSAGGVGYARRVAERVGILIYFDHVLAKERGTDGRWRLDPSVAGGEMTCVDDQPDELPEGVRTVGLFPYVGPNPHDRALQKVIDFVNCGRSSASCPRTQLIWR